jgi:CPA2 family monovalent cation:H+ antiporter-2
MTQIPLLQDAVLMLGLSVLVIYVFQRFKLPTVIGFLATGILFGPHGMSLIGHPKYAHEVEIMAEIGVILLLFIIGLEFSMKELAALRKVVILGGFGQVGLTVGLVALLAFWMGQTWPQGVFMGFLFSLSSTAIVLKILQERGSIHGPPGRIALGMLIFQDIIVVPMMLVTPMLAGAEANIGAALGILLLKAAGVTGAVIVLSRYLVPKMLREIARTKSRELFLLSILVICFTVAFGTSALGLSLALGAFMAGLTISGSPYSHQATSLIIPFREVFASFFFLSVGMLLNLGFIADHFGVILALVLSVVILKFAVIASVVRLLGFPLRTALISGLTLFQVGEFAFILSGFGQTYGLMAAEQYQYFLSVSVITMAMTPFFITGSARWVKVLEKKLPNRLDTPAAVQPLAGFSLHQLSGHLIIIGYGLNGQHMARAARIHGIDHVVVDMEVGLVERAIKDGSPAYFGDATQGFILEELKVFKASVVVVAVSDIMTSRNIVSQIRHICHKVHIMVRCHDVREADALYELGAGEVISDAMETSVEIFTRVLHHYLVEPLRIEDFVNKIRTSEWQMSRPIDFKTTPVLAGFPELRTAAVPLITNIPGLTGVSVQEALLREKYHMSILAIRREGNLITRIAPDTCIQLGDVLYVFGQAEEVQTFLSLVRVDLAH